MQRKPFTRVLLLGVLGVLASAPDSLIWAQSLQQGSGFVSLRPYREEGNSILIDGGYRTFTNVDYGLRAEGGYFYKPKASIGAFVGLRMNHAWGSRATGTWPDGQQRRTFTTLRAELAHRNYISLYPRLHLFIRLAVGYQWNLGNTWESRYYATGEPHTYYSNRQSVGLDIQPGLAYQLTPRLALEAYALYTRFQFGFDDLTTKPSHYLSLGSSGNVQGFSLGANYSFAAAPIARPRLKKLEPIAPGRGTWVIGGGLSVYDQNFESGGDTYNSHVISVGPHVRYFWSPRWSLNTRVLYHLDQRASAFKDVQSRVEVELERYFPLVKKLYAGAGVGLSYLYWERNDPSSLGTRTHQISLRGYAELLYKFSDRWSLNTQLASLGLLSMDRSKEGELIRNYVEVGGAGNFTSYFYLGIAYWIPGKDRIKSTLPR